jgi:hypothetical protein
LLKTVCKSFGARCDNGHYKQAKPKKRAHGNLPRSA